MGQLKELNAAGAAQVDEAVACTEAVTFGAQTVYRGYLLNSCHINVAEPTSPDYGVWTAAEKGGTRKSVLLDGLPAQESEVAIDTISGAVLAYSSQTLYACYLAHYPIYFTSAGLRIILPTADPHQVGVWWADGGAVKISAG